LNLHWFIERFKDSLFQVLNVDDLIGWIRRDIVDKYPVRSRPTPIGWGAAMAQMARIMPLTAAIMPAALMLKLIY
tara:strand:- start:7447 stop:7671 length:225 start_codon:yes stop_codon:yes gene_type:complete